MKLKNFTQKDRHGNMISYDFYESDDNMGVPEMQSIPQHPGSPKGTDTVPAWLTPGEFVMNAEATRMFEPQIEQMNNAGRAVQAQQGGTIPEYAANGGPVYFAEGSGGFFDKLLNMFSDDDTPKVPDATQSVVPPPDSSRADRVAALIEASKTDGPTRPDPTMSNKMYMDFLKNKEGFRNEAYLDSSGVPTIGYGFTEGVQMGDTIDEKTANERLLKEMAKTDQDYNKLVTADLNPNQQAAVKSLLYNIGGPQFANSKARAALNAGDFESFKKEAAEFRMANGKVIPGLENRRRDELELFFKPYKANRPETSNAPMSMVSPEEQAAFQRDVEAAQKATREQGMYDPDGNMEAIQAGIDQAQILEDQRRMQQGQVPPMVGAAVPPKPTDDPLVSTVPPSNTSRDDRVDVLNNAAKGGNTVIGTLQGNDVYQDDLGEYINTPEGPVYLDGNQLQAMTKTPASVPSSNAVPAVPPSNTSRDDRVAKLTDAATVPGASSNTDVPLPDDDIFSTPAMSTDPTASMLARQQALKIGPQDIKQPPPPNVSLNKGEYGVNDTIIREDANGNPITYKWDSSKDAYVDDEGLEYNRGIGERVSSLFKSETVENAEPETGDTQIGTLNGNPVYMGQDGKPYVMEDLEVLGTSAGVQKMNIQPWQTDDIKMLPKENRPVAGPKTPSPKDKDGLVPLPMDTSIPDELSGTPMDSSASVPKPAAAPPKPETESSSSTDLPDELQAGQEMNSNKAIEDAGKTAPPEQINEAESFLSGIFGDLFDSDELKRMAIMYVGGRVLGGSHSGSLNFATKQYVKRVDSKVSAHKEYVKELTKGGTYTPKSIALYNKTKNISDLEKKGATYAPTGGAPITKMIPQFNKEGQVTSYKKATLVPVKNSITGGTHYQSASGTVMHPAQIASLNDYREELDETKEAYKQRRSRILSDMEGYFSEIRDKPGNFKGEGKDKEYIVGVGPKEAALAYYDWAKKQGVDPDSTAGRKVMTQAYETMVAEAAGKDIKYTPNDFTRFLEDQQLRETTGAPELFIINEDAVMNKKATPKYVQADKMSLLYQNLDTVISGIPNSSTNRGAIIGIAIQKWNKLDSTEDGRTLRKKYNDSAEKSAGESGFYKYMMDTAQALHAELNKPKQ